MEIKPDCIRDQIISLGRGKGEMVKQRFKDEKIWTLGLTVRAWVVLTAE